MAVPPVCSCDVLKCVLDVVRPDDIVSGCVPSGTVIVNGTEVLVLLVHRKECFNHFIKRSEEQRLLPALFNVKVSHHFSSLTGYLVVWVSNGNVSPLHLDKSLPSHNNMSVVKVNNFSQQKLYFMTNNKITHNFVELHIDESCATIYCIWVKNNSHIL